MVELERILAEKLDFEASRWRAVEALISGDRRHLLPLGEHRGVGIITPQALPAGLRGA